MSIEKLDLQSPDIVQQNIDKIAELFPNCITESADGRSIDFDLLKQELSSSIVEGHKERYRLEWPGKREAIVTANLPTTKTLRPVPEDSVDFDNTQNIYIEGDNLEVLKLLQESYLGKVKMIYIDPPYNTGNDFVYNDSFKKETQEELFESGQIDEYNQRLQANPETAGRYHSDWLSMMYPRLKLARNLLTDDGFLFISIDDHELDNLTKIGSEIFGQSNFLGLVSWQKVYSSRMDAKSFSKDIDYILVFRKNITSFIGQESFIQNEKQFSSFDEIKELKYRARSLRKDGSNSRRIDRPNLFYSITAPDGSNIFPIKPDGSEGTWRWSSNKVDDAIKEGEIEFKKNNETWEVLVKQYLDPNASKPPSTFWPYTYGHNHGAVEELKKLFKSNLFSSPKPTSLLKKIIEISLKKNDIVLDFFAGSSSLGDALMQFNCEQMTNHKYLLVQLPELTDEKSEAFKAGYKNICEIGKERIRRAGKAIIKEQEEKLAAKEAELEKLTNGKLNLEDPQVETLKEEITKLEISIAKLDTGFRVYRLADSNMQDVYYKPQDFKQDQLDAFADNIKPGRTSDDLLAQIMLDWGLELSHKIERISIAGKEVFKVAHNSLFACFDKGVNEAFAKEIATHQPLRVVFRDNGFESDNAKINVQQLLKQLSPNTEMKVI